MNFDFTPWSINQTGIGTISIPSGIQSGNAAESSSIQAANPEFLDQFISTTGNQEHYYNKEGEEVSPMEIFLNFTSSMVQNIVNSLFSALQLNITQGNTQNQLPQNDNLEDTNSGENSGYLDNANSAQSSPTLVIRDREGNIVRMAEHPELNDSKTFSNYLSQGIMYLDKLDTAKEPTIQDLNELGNQMLETYDGKNFSSSEINDLISQIIDTGAKTREVDHELVSQLTKLRDEATINDIRNNPDMSDYEKEIAIKYEMGIQQAYREYQESAATVIVSVNGEVRGSQQRNNPNEVLDEKIAEITANYERKMIELKCGLSVKSSDEVKDDDNATQEMKDIADAYEKDVQREVTFYLRYKNSLHLQKLQATSDNKKDEIARLENDLDESHNKIMTLLVRNYENSMSKF